MKPATRIGLIALILVTACNSGTAHRDPGQDVANAHGAASFAPERARYLRFDFVVRKGGVTKATFRHLLDRVTGDYRYEAEAAIFAGVPFLDGKTQSWRPIGLDLPEGRLVALGNRRSRTGRVWIDGREQPAELAERVRQRVDNDSFWLLLPFALAAPNVKVDVDGGGTDEPMWLTVTFEEGSGDTPGDVYRILVDPVSHRLLRTEIDLQNQDVTVKADWREEVEIATVLFYRERVLPDKTLAFENLGILSTTPDGVFDRPDVDM